MVKLPGAVMALFRAHFDIVESTAGDHLAQISSASPDILLCSVGSTRLGAGAIAALPASVKVIATYSVGHDHVDLDAARLRSIAVFYTPGVLADSVADSALLLLLGAARRATESIALIRSRAWTGWHPDQLLGVELRGKRLGIFGMGEIGRRIARRASAFGMTIAYTNRRRVPEDTEALFVPDPRDLLRDSDVFLLACPSTPETRGFINFSTLMLAKESLIIVNTGRGDLVQDDALIDALLHRRILAAGLDVFNDEPAIDTRYFALPNAFILPHIGSSTFEARIGMGQALVSAVCAWSAGEHAPNRLV
ncbi:MAG TPA: NAD(P)-dependent oxidoreductase [Steroidobacteraceae bacterium]|jgi:glyoxylate reductase